MEYRERVASVARCAAVDVTPLRLVGAVLKCLRGALWSFRGVRNVVELEGGDGKRVLISPALVPPDAPLDIESLPITSAQRDELHRLVNTLGVQLRFGKVVDVPLSYENYTMPELLKMLLPPSVVPLSGFEQVGHIAHVNLSDAHLPFQGVIGQVILDTNPTVRTVVNKIDSISSIFREFKMDVIAGDASPSALTAVVKQHGFLFRVPYDKVYWNSRLQEEHQRLVATMTPGDELYDAMAGVGPFAIPAAWAGMVVHANDLNPHAVEALKYNAVQNGVLQRITAYNMDGREFLDTVLRTALETSPLRGGEGRRHVSMNLPALAVQFLDTFRRPSWRSGRILDRQPHIHCYLFSAAADPVADAVSQVETVLGVPLTPECNTVVTDVRDVAPTKRMLCVSFRLPFALTELKTSEQEELTEAPQKRRRTEP